MPEDREKTAAALIAQNFYSKHHERTSWVVKGLQADACKRETGTARHAQGHVDRIDATCAWMRGCKDAQSYIWPELWRRSKANPSPPSIDTLHLDGISHTGRAIILNFRYLVLQVRF
jgi:hypothetical protein